MAYIKVNINQLEQTAKAVDTYVRSHKQKINSMETTMANLGSGWKGPDYNQACAQLDKMTQDGSVSKKMLDSLCNYADSLRSAGKAYKDLRDRAINRAKTRCK